MKSLNEIVPGDLVVAEPSYGTGEILRVASVTVQLIETTGYYKSFARADGEYQRPTSESLCLKIRHATAEDIEKNKLSWAKLRIREIGNAIDGCYAPYQKPLKTDQIYRIAAILEE